MKNIYLPGLLILLICVPMGNAQVVEISPFIGYQFGGNFSAAYSNEDFQDIDIDESENYGLILGFNVAEGSQIELIYNRQDTTVDLNRFLNRKVDLTIEYFHFGGNYGMDFGGVHPYVAASMGIAVFNPEFSSSETRFSWSLGGGTRLKVTDFFGFRVDARWFGTRVDSNQEAWCGDYYCVYYYDNTYLYQFNVTGGIYFAF